MGTDYGEKEREFIGALGEDTGLDLEGWMAAIAATGLSDRNAIIDWLRHKGFAFSRASWLERIHHNGGRLIYSSRAETPQPERAPDPPMRAAPVAGIAPFSAPSPARPPALDVDACALLAQAKGLKPLAGLVLREIAAVAPEAKFEARAPLIVVSAKSAFAALWPLPKQLRLYGDFDCSGALDVRAAEPVSKAAPPFQRMILLDDARRVDQAFRDLIATAISRSKD